MKEEDLEKKEHPLIYFFDWAIYTVFAFLFTIPFLYGEWWKHICTSLILGFFAGMGNRIIRELSKLNDK